MCSRNDFEDLFLQRGYLRDEICSMPEDVFRRLLDSFLNEDNSNSNPEIRTSSQYRYVSQRQAQENQRRYEEYVQNMRSQYQNEEDEDEAMRIAMMNSLNENYANAPGSSTAADSANSADNANTGSSADIVDEQNAEYANARNEAYQTELENSFAKHFEENERIIEQEREQQREAELVGRYYGLKQEPATGVTVGIMLRGKRFVRRFDPAELAADVYSWIAGQTIHEDERLYLDMFQLKKATGEVVDPDATLQDQNIKGRIMLQIDML